MSSGPDRLTGRGTRHRAPGVRVLMLLTPVLLAAWPTVAPAGEIIAAKKSKVFHTHPEECGSAKKILAGNRIKFASVAEAKKAGRRLCKRCASLSLRDREDAEKPGSTRPGRETGRQPATGEGAQSQPVADVAGIARVIDVLPGGTIELDIDEKVCLLGVVCPGVGQPHVDDAVRFILEKTRGRRIRLSHNLAPGPVRHRDALGRSRVYVTPEPDGRDLGGELLFQGYAWMDRSATFDRRPEYTRREEEAWHAGRGIWKPLKGAAGKRQVVTGRHAHHYHDPQCPHAAHLAGKLTLTVNEAKARKLPPCARVRIEQKTEPKAKRTKRTGKPKG